MSQESQDFDDFDAALDGLASDRRSFLKRVVVGTAFAAPVVASFSMTGVQAVYAQTPTASGAVAAASASTTTTTSANQPPSTTTTTSANQPPSTTTSTTGQAPSTTTSTTGQAPSTTTTTTNANTTLPPRLG